MMRHGLAVALALIAACLPAAAQVPPPLERRSSYLDMLPETRAMQDDDTANPGMLSVLEGESLWRQTAGATQKACSDCHGDTAAGLRGVAARYPAFDPMRGLSVSIEGRINLCRTEKQTLSALAYESRELLALTTYVVHQSRGVPIAPAEAALVETVAKGRQIFEQRQGQLNLSCANCHDANAGRKLAGNTIPEAHPTGYPIYRLEWQSVGSLQRRLRNCLTGMRAETYDYGSAELVALEAFLMQRARGMRLETPGVRP